jgi:hypothetical protein
MTVFYFQNALAYYNTGVVAVKLKVVGLDPTTSDFTTPAFQKTRAVLKLKNFFCFQNALGCYWRCEVFTALAL